MDSSLDFGLIGSSTPGVSKVERQSKWRENIAVGGDEFMDGIKRELLMGRVRCEGRDYCLRESQSPYASDVDAIEVPIDNTCRWDVLA